MPTPYRVEIYNRDYTLDTWAVCSIPSYHFDYLTLEEYKVMAIGRMEPSRGNYVQVINGNDVVYQGVLSSYDNASQPDITMLSVRPLLSLVDFDAFIPSLSESSSLENVLQNVIEWGRKNNPEASANLPGIVVTTSTTTAGTLAVEGNIISAWDLAVQAIKNYGIVIDAALDVGSHHIRFSISKVTATVTIEADLPNIAEKTLTLQENFGSPNCCLIINKDDPTETQWYGNTTAYNGVWKVAEVSVKEDESFADVADAQARKLIQPSEFDNSIEITVREDDKLVKATAIGTHANIITNGKSIPSVLTGIEIQNNMKTLVFGAVRLDLTKQLIMQRREVR